MDCIQKFQFHEKRRGEGVMKFIHFSGWRTNVAPVGMNTDCTTAFRTSVFLLLTIEEFLHSMVLNEVQILKYAHVVFLRVAIFKFLKMYTWIVWTFKTEFYFVFGKKFAVLF